MEGVKCSFHYLFLLYIIYIERKEVKIINTIKTEDIFTDDALNIFTDASIQKYKDETFGCAGAILVHGNIRSKNLEQHNQIIRRTTNNNSEIKAVRLGIQESLKWKNNYRVIRLFSDSQISIFGIRERIFKWKLNDKGLYIGSEKTPIKNQDIMLEIVNFIVDHQLKIEFYHQAGHVNVRNKNDLLDAIHVFAASNNIRDLISYNFISTISSLNNMVDANTRNLLHNIDKSTLDYYAYDEAINYIGNQFDSAAYMNLIKY